jgi:hypothetical protein
VTETTVKCVPACDSILGQFPLPEHSTCETGPVRMSVSDVTRGPWENRGGSYWMGVCPKWNPM